MIRKDQAALFEDQGDALASEQALDQVLHQIWVDMLGFAGVEPVYELWNFVFRPDPYGARLQAVSGDKIPLDARC